MSCICCMHFVCWPVDAKPNHIKLVALQGDLLPDINWEAQVRPVLIGPKSDNGREVMTTLNMSGYEQEQGGQT